MLICVDVVDVVRWSDGGVETKKSMLAEGTFLVAVTPNVEVTRANWNGEAIQSRGLINSNGITDGWFVYEHADGRAFCLSTA